MRSGSWLAGCVLALSLMTVAAFAAPASSPAASSANGTSEWCGFHDKAGAQVTCGYSNLDDCKKALGGNKDAVCMPDPAFAREERPGGLHIGGSHGTA